MRNHYPLSTEYHWKNWYFWQPACLLKGNIYEDWNVSAIRKEYQNTACQGGMVLVVDLPEVRQ